MLLSMTTNLLAQTSTVSGNIMSVPSMQHKKAKITFTNKTTGKQYIDTTDTNGDYSKELPDGNYFQRVEVLNNFLINDSGLVVSNGLFWQRYNGFDYTYPSSTLDRDMIDTTTITEPSYNGSLLAVTRDLTNGATNTWDFPNRPIPIFPNRAQMPSYDTLAYRLAIEETVSKSNGKGAYVETADSNIVGINFKYADNNHMPVPGVPGYTTYDEYFPNGTLKRVTIWINTDVIMPKNGFEKELGRARRLFANANTTSYIMHQLSTANGWHDDEGKVMELMYSFRTPGVLLGDPLQAIPGPYIDSVITSIDWPTAPGQSEVVQPVNHAINQPTNPTIRWRTVTGENAGQTVYRLQVDDNSDFSSPLINNEALIDTFLAVSGLANNTQYFVRVQGENDFRPGLWSASSDFTTILPLPSQPTLTTPVDNATNQNQSLTLEWIVGSNASETIVQLGTDSLFNTYLMMDSTASNSQPISGLAAHTKYFWRAKSKNTSGYSNFTTPFKFTTKDNLPTVIAIRDTIFDEDAGLRTIDDDLTNNITDPDGDTYVASIISSSPFLNAIKNGNALQINPTANSNGQGTIILRYTGQYASPQDTINVIINPINDAPSAVFLIEPGDDDTLRSDTVAFRWSSSSDVDGDILTYQIHLSGNDLDTTMVGFDTTLTLMERLLVGSYAWYVSVSDGVTIVNSDTNSFYQDIVDAITHSTVKLEFALYQNYPNPFNPSTKIRYSIAKAGHVDLRIYNVLGQSVKVLAQGRQESGLHEANWNGRNDDGDFAGSGIYICRLTVGSEVRVSRMLLLK